MTVKIDEEREKKTLADVQKVVLLCRMLPVTRDASVLTRIDKLTGRLFLVYFV